MRRGGGAEAVLADALLANGLAREAGEQAAKVGPIEAAAIELDLTNSAAALAGAEEELASIRQLMAELASPK